MDTKELDTIEKLEELSFNGIDADLATSLFEYGMAWKVEDKQTVFIYGISIDTEGNYNRFDRCSIDNDIDIYDEYAWANVNDILSFIGQTEEEFDQMPLGHRIFDLVQYYGRENVFGSSYWEGFEIQE